MPYDEQKRRSSVGPHHITLEDRSKLTISGVEDVESFDESAITLSTQEGYLLIRGSGLHIEKLNLEGGELFVQGTVDSISYEEDSSHQGGLLSRLFHA
jgi:sporulation protein YabP